MTAGGEAQVLPDWAGVEGFCPMGCGRTLFLADGGAVTCSYRHCPRRSAAAELLADSETEHIVSFAAAEFTVQHPLRERLDGALFDCGLHTYLASLDGPPVLPGRYRARWWPPPNDRSSGHWAWIPL